MAIDSNSTKQNVMALWGEKILRIGCGLFFLMAGVGHLLGFNLTVEGASIIAENHQVTQILAVGAILSLVLGGVSFVTGRFVRWGAAALILFLIPATFLHAAVMEMAANTASILVASADENAKQSIESLRNIAMQGHQANIMKNLLLILVCTFFATRPSSISTKRS